MRLQPFNQRTLALRSMNEGEGFVLITAPTITRIQNRGSYRLIHVAGRPTPYPVQESPEILTIMLEK